MARQKTLFATPIEGYGIQGMKLNLNYAQCQELNSIRISYGKILERRGSFDPRDAKDDLNMILSRLDPFLALFEGFKADGERGLWNNTPEEVKQIDLDKLGAEGLL